MTERACQSHGLWRHRTFLFCSKHYTLEPKWWHLYQSSTHQLVNYSKGVYNICSGVSGVAWGHDLHPPAAEHQTQLYSNKRFMKPSNNPLLSIKYVELVGSDTHKAVNARIHRSAKQAEEQEWRERLARNSMETKILIAYTVASFLHTLYTHYVPNRHISSEAMWTDRNEMHLKQLDCYKARGDS